MKNTLSVIKRNVVKKRPAVSRKKILTSQKFQVKVLANTSSKNVILKSKSTHSKKKITSIQIKKVNFRSYLKKRNFRVAIFGSARIEKGDKVYREVYHLAKAVGKNGYDVITGGGPGLMAAANEGHSAGDKAGKAESIGLVIKLPWENEPNKGVEAGQEFNKFSNRLETFLDLLSVAVITKGGLGTVLELAYMWQYTQVRKVRRFPIILVGENWRKLMTWFKKYVLAQNLMSKEDFDNIFIAKNNQEALKLIEQAHEVYLKTPNSIKPELKSKLYQK